MNNDYFNYIKFVNDLTSILSIGYYYEYSFKVIEKRICNSAYFSCFNKEILTSIAYKDTNSLIKDFYYDIGVCEKPTNFEYKEFEWVSMIYINIIKNTSLNFETIFCYLPIEKALAMFEIYHELDMNKMIDYFVEERKKASIISKRMKSLGLTIGFVSNECGLSSSMIGALKNRKKDIKKLGFESAIKLSNILQISCETLLNN